MKRITGTFLDEVTYDIPSQNWGRVEWRREFDAMKEAGIDTVIIIRCGLRDMAVFPSETLGILDVPDLARLFLDEAERTGMKLFFGTYDSGNLGWTMNAWEADWDITRRLLPEILHRYNGHPAFHGWYIAPETCVATTGSVEIFARYSGLMKELTPEKPVLISPYYPSFVYKDYRKEERHRRFIEDWHRILSQAPGIDICAFQDTSCSPEPDTKPLFELEEYVREVHDLLKERRVQMWNNVEAFSRAMPWKFPPIDWRWLQRKMAVADPYCEKQITFEFNHFMSPNSAWESARNLYRRYVEDILGETSPDETANGRQ